ncbi:MAG: TIGR01212 family radical SAM protein, partial [Clostridiales bacterium]|nr:TIGR01212 family radical SAM protein [Clostridiales bacterium]
MEWNGKRYHSLNYFLRKKFGEKVFKISLDAGFTCPNRDGSITKGGCIFCSPRGSGDFTIALDDISRQFDEAKKMMQKKWKSGKYIAYFQAYTNTYAPVDVLRERYYSVMDKENLVGMAIATRPDCLQPEIIELLKEINKKTYLWVELGLQTINKNTTKLINSGYTLDSYIESVDRLKKAGIDIVSHCILGLPGESRDDMLKTVDFIANTGTQGIKLHLLHLMKDTPMVELYEKGVLTLLEKDQYVDLIVDAVERLPSE